MTIRARQRDQSSPLGSSKDEQHLCPRCGATQNPPGMCMHCLMGNTHSEHEPKLNQSIELRTLIGKGGMGEVFRAHDTRLERDVAVKLLAHQVAEDQQFRARFEREAKLLAQMNHPNIVTLFDYGETEGHCYLVMELVDGESLAAAMPMNREQALRVTEQVASALAYAHTQGLVHRDVKPENILVRQDGYVKVADFGIARLAQSASSQGHTLTQTGLALGTPAYCAPEVLQGAPADPRMDVYALGMLLYQLITNRLPTATYEPVGDGLDRVIQRALSRRPEDRYENAGAFLNALKPFLSREVMQPEGLPPEEESWLWAVALIQTVSSAIALWALYISITPKIIDADDMLPTVMFGVERLSDGRFLSRARFEVWPFLAAAFSVVFAISLVGLLRWHWRRAGYERRNPAKVIGQSTAVLISGLLQSSIYLIYRFGVGQTGHLIESLFAVLGGIAELVTLWLFWIAILECWRHQKLLWREVRLWIGIGLAVVPPVIQLYIEMLSLSVA